MPYTIKGKTVYKKVGKKLKKKAKARSRASAKRMVRVLRAVEHGWKPSKKRRRRR
jgi:hypothetical protein